jgi:tRNA pseudouridine32 synthase/23S rRNA pseudouridine746 synthase
MEPFTHHIPPPCHEEVAILYQDEHLLVVNKPEGLLSVPGRFVKDCVLNRILPDFPTATVMHRLDLDSSGILIIPLNKTALRDLNRQQRERMVEKRYVAVVFGLVESDQGEIDKPIARDWFNRPRQVIDFAAGKAALTRYRVLDRDPVRRSTRLLLCPATGRTHQLRLHLASIDHPILGCDLYAHEEALQMSSRLMLHASFIAFTHPHHGKRVEFECAPPFLSTSTDGP